MSNSFLELALSSRDMAKRARRLAEEMHSDLNRLRLERYAAELDEQALNLESAATRPH